MDTQEAIEVLYDLAIDESLIEDEKNKISIDAFGAELKKMLTGCFPKSLTINEDVDFAIRRLPEVLQESGQKLSFDLDGQIQIPGGLLERSADKVHEYNREHNPNSIEYIQANRSSLIENAVVDGMLTAAAINFMAENYKDLTDDEIDLAIEHLDEFSKEQQDKMVDSAFEKNEESIEKSSLSDEEKEIEKKRNNDRKKVSKVIKSNVDNIIDKCGDDGTIPPSEEENINKLVELYNAMNPKNKINVFDLDANMLKKIRTFFNQSDLKYSKVYDQIMAMEDHRLQKLILDAIENGENIPDDIRKKLVTTKIDISTLEEVIDNNKVKNEYAKSKTKEQKGEVIFNDDERSSTKRLSQLLEKVATTRDVGIMQELMQKLYVTREIPDELASKLSELGINVEGIQSDLQIRKTAKNNLKNGFKNYQDGIRQDSQSSTLVENSLEDIDSIELGNEDSRN